MEFTTTANTIEYAPVSPASDEDGLLASMISAAVRGRPFLIVADDSRLNGIPEWEDLTVRKEYPALTTSGYTTWRAGEPSPRLVRAIVDSSVFTWDGLWIIPFDGASDQAAADRILGFDAREPDFGNPGEMLLPQGDGTGIVWILEPAANLDSKFEQLKKAGVIETPS